MNEFFDSNGNPIFRNYVKRSNLSRNVKKSHNSGLKLIDYCDEARLKEWYLIHKKRMEDLGSSPIPFQIFENAWKFGAEAENVKFFFADYKGETVGGCMNIFNKEIFDIFMMSSDMDTAQELGTNFFLVDSALKWVHNKGIPVFNWQSSPTKGGTFEFKEQWGSKIIPYYYYTKIIGDISHLHKIDLKDLNEAYKWHFVAPYHTILNPEVIGVVDKSSIHKITLEKSKM
jgi:hypothetical protein